ncbi:FAD-binding and (Fe-S)-binding domain-containing protein [Hahella ganghwensis]|uniref:FAD-binding and (Fe-S)-binding domain-containing protein n=1 Tax=Hahella ganghwensis TaxID=286420 RepID=UPI000369E3E6|nr:FAD-binding and (Fe-S)-binding domain-containing protein [Hahella ganghwensis]
MNSDLTSFIERISTVIPPERLIKDPLRRLAYGTDASFYRLIPQLVVRAESEAEVVILLQAAGDYRIPLTFRAAGTSLSGQAVTDSVLVQLQGWKQHEILDGGQRIKLQPGIIGAHANRHLAPYARKIGPDPASINAAKIGGIAANNASGMCCGTRHNSYHTLADMRLILADGTILNTADQESRQRFQDTHSDTLKGLSNLRQKILSNNALKEKIQHKYRLKNTTGYGLNALIDFEDPIDILIHLMIGSEGTLGFISSITYRTVEDHPAKSTTLVFFADVRTTCEAVAALKSSPVDAVELIDRRGLSAIENKTGVPEFVKHLPDGAAALLIETRAQNQSSLETKIDTINEVLSGYNILNQLPFTQIPEQIAQLWNIRKGLFPALGALRKNGTTVVIEDVAFPVPDLADGVLKLQALFERYDYHDALIFGHALEGNLHFVFAQDLNDPDAIERYRCLMDDVAQLVAVEYGGSLKAEHGTGRNMAPFVALEWGENAYGIMQEIKTLLDPDDLLNPGVILNADPEIHLKNLKPMPPVDPLVDKCIECGFCEPVCPSRNLSLTPRQRIVISREIERLDSSSENPALLKTLQQDYLYQGDDTCAACGLCATSCPVGINTGDLTRMHRHQHNKIHTDKAQWAADHFRGITRATRAMLGTADILHGLMGRGVLEGSTRAINKVTKGKVPVWHPYLPKVAPRLTESTPVKDHSPCSTDPLHGQLPDKVVYFSSCATRTMGPARGDSESQSVTQANLSLLAKAGFQVIFPENIDSHCCGMPFQSKGFFDTANQKAEQLLNALWQASEEGRLPVFSDTSPCTMRLLDQIKSLSGFSGLRLLDTVDFIHDHLMPRLEITPTNMPTALHITCSTTRMGIADKLTAIARTCCTSVLIPDDITCCGFAGDKGFTQPELNASALAPLKTQIQENQCEAGISNSRSCEIGLSLHSGIHYHGISLLVDKVSQPKPRT